MSHIICTFSLLLYLSWVGDIHLLDLGLYPSSLEENEGSFVLLASLKNYILKIQQQ